MYLLAITSPAGAHTVLDHFWHSAEHQERIADGWVGSVMVYARVTKPHLYVLARADMMLDGVGLHFGGRAAREAFPDALVLVDSRERWPNGDVVSVRPGTPIVPLTPR